MAGIVLYIVTLLLESISVFARFTLVSSLVAMLAGGDAGLVAGAIAAGGPIVYSLLVLAGIPSGHILVRMGLRARKLRPDEQTALDPVLATMRGHGIPLPRQIFTVDDDEPNAAISGRTLYIFRGLYGSPYLPAVVAHELGHFNSLDGRLLLAIRALTVPGGFLIAEILQSILRWVVYLLAIILVAVLFIVVALFRIRLDAATGAFVGLTYNLLRFLIIFAVGGVGPTLLGSVWGSYFLEREFAADAYAGRLGYANDLIRFFEKAVLNDVAIPWYQQPTHPPTSRRIEELRQVAEAHPQISSAPEAAAARPATGAARAAAAAQHPAGATAALPARPAPAGRWTPALLITSALLITALVAFFLMGGQEPVRGDAIQPTPGPTPTLGLPTP